MLRGLVRNVSDAGHAANLIPHDVPHSGGIRGDPLCAGLVSAWQNPERFRVDEMLGVRMPSMAKKTGMSDSSLWIATIVLLTLAVWMYFKR